MCVYGGGGGGGGGVASYPVPISIPTSFSSRAEVGMEIGTGYEARGGAAFMSIHSHIPACFVAFPHPCATVKMLKMLRGQSASTWRVCLG